MQSCTTANKDRPLVVLLGVEVLCSNGWKRWFTTGSVVSRARTMAHTRRIGLAATRAIPPLLCRTAQRPKRNITEHEDKTDYVLELSRISWVTGILYTM
jgi:hypothetical protein